MAGIMLEKKKQIYKSGQPMTALHLITAGKVKVNHPCGSYLLSKGDVIGICEISSEIHFLEYETLEDCQILTYPIASMEVLEELLSKHPDVARLFLLSLFHQLGVLMDQFSVAETECASLHQNYAEDIRHYMELCATNGITPLLDEDLSAVNAYMNNDTPDVWLSSYYLGLRKIYSSAIAGQLTTEGAVSLGLLRKGSLDFYKTFTVMDDLAHFHSKIASCYFHETKKDLFTAMCSLYYQLPSSNKDSNSLYSDLNRIVLQFDGQPYVKESIFEGHVSDFRTRLLAMESKAAADDGSQTISSVDEVILNELNGSLKQILDFSGLDEDSCQLFTQLIDSFKKAPEKNDLSDELVSLRKRLTALYLKLYKACVHNALVNSYLPVSVKMFLHFGYLDETLAGQKNCLTLYHLACGMGNTEPDGIYTFYQWLQAIYRGEKNPSRNEFEEDFAFYIHKQKLSGALSDAQCALLESDPIFKVDYELDNLFPPVNKMTFGRITTYNPIFCEDNVLKDLSATMVTEDNVRKALNYIKSIDYSVFYRESLDYDHLDLMGKETIHLEYIPDIILMPNVGTRGVMWQEIDGKKRNTRARMFLSVFHLEDITTTMVRLAGEFRWEMCKRVQGSRWNDVSDRSLTSEYFDYIQFYKKNHELSSDAKDKIRIALQRAKNSFKEMFVRDYMIWVIFESKGSARLNRQVRKMMLTYCPFPSGISDTLTQNPLFSELLSRRKILTEQKLRRLDQLLQKTKGKNQEILPVVESEKKFLQGQI